MKVVFSPLMCQKGIEYKKTLIMMTNTFKVLLNYKKKKKVNNRREK